jgi:hypothetical protein
MNTVHNPGIIPEDRALAAKIAQINGYTHEVVVPAYEAARIDLAVPDPKMAPTLVVPTVTSTRVVPTSFPKTPLQESTALVHLSSPGNVARIVNGLGDSRHDIAPGLLGRMAGASLLHQYYAARAETGFRWVPTPRLLLNALYGTVRLGAPLAALGAGVALDVAIFGGAAHDLIKVNPLFGAMAVGSLVFAVGAGITKGLTKGAVLGLMLGASAGASLLAADDPAFIQHFSTVLPASLSQTADNAAGDAASAKAKMAYWQGVIDHDTKQLNTGGRNGMPILGDGFAGNDAQGHELEKQILDAQSHLGEATAEAARAGNDSGVAAKQSPALFYGKLVGAGYIWTWLAASQLVVAAVIDGLDKTLSQEGNRDNGQRIARYSWRALRRSDAAVEAQSGLILADFESALTGAAQDNPAKAEKFAKLFIGPSMEQMQQTAGGVFRGAVPRRDGMWRTLKNIVTRTPLPPKDRFSVTAHAYGEPAHDAAAIDAGLPVVPAINREAPKPAPRVA